VVSGGNTSLYYEDVYARLVEQGLDARAVDVSDLPWTEVDTREDLDRARALVASGRLDAPVPALRSVLRSVGGLAVALSSCDRSDGDEPETQEKQGNSASPTPGRLANDTGHDGHTDVARMPHCCPRSQATNSVNSPSSIGFATTRWSVLRGAAAVLLQSGGTSVSLPKQGGERYPMADRRADGTKSKTVQRAIILAAGTGSRLVANESYPKPLKQVSGVALLVRVLRTLQSEGIREAVVIVGYRGEAIKTALLAEPSLGLTLHFVDNAAYDRKNGVSLLAAKAFVDQECILSMADHLYSPEVVRRLRSFDAPAGACTLGIDYDIERVFDLDDATKVRMGGGKIVDIGKDIADYNAIDTGVFRIGPSLIAELDRIYQGAGDVSLSDGVRALAQRGKFLGCDVGDARWIDVDTPEAFARAEAMVRVFGDDLGDEPSSQVRPIDPEAMELFAPTWVRAAQPYKEDHFEKASSRDGISRMMSNESPFAPSERVIAAIVEAARKGHLYPSSGRELRRRLGEREGYGEANAILGSGSTEIIDTVIRTFVAPGEEVLLSVPTFSMYEARTRVTGGIPVLVPMTEEHDFDVPALLSAITERTKVIFLCTPNNPTGNRITEAQMRRVLRLGLPTVIDEAYHELGETPDSLSHLLAEFPNAIVIRTFSKAFGLAGFRLGYAIAHAAVIKLMMRVKVPWNVPATTLAAATAALDDVAEFEARMAELRAGRAYLVRELSRIGGLDVMPSEGNFVLIDAHETGVSAEDILAAMFAEGVLVRSLAVHRAQRGFLRVTVGTREDNERCVETMRLALQRLAPRKSHIEMHPSAVPVARASASDAEL
jgi:histidinol-phosphate aminotransferase